MQCACALLPSVVSLALLHPSTLTQEKQDFREKKKKKKKLLNIKYVFLVSIQLLYETFLILS